MAMQKVEFEFPEADGEEIEVEPSNSLEMGKEPEPEPEPLAAEAEVEVEVINDVPEADRGRTPSDPPEDVTDEELQDYSDKVKKRIKHFSKGYHDERRAKEAAQREKDELERLAQNLINENKRLNNTVGQSQAAILEQAQRAVAGEINQAKNAYREAHEAGNSEAVVEAQERLTNAKLREAEVKNIGARALQQQKPNVQQGEQAQAQQPAQRPQADEKAVAWARENTWYGQPDKTQMTALALGYHEELKNAGVDLTSDDYYGKIDARMRAVFPEEFEDAAQASPEPKPRANVVAPATRSTAPKKVRLTQTQVNLAKRLGVPIELYAKQVAEEMRKENG